MGATTTLSNVTPGGTWSAGNTKATVGSSTGIVTGVAPGIVNITYNVSGNIATATVTVNSNPAAISGTLNVCAGSTSALSNTVAGGSWSSTVTSVATVDTDGVVTGITAGTTVISYVLGTGCYKSSVFTVNAMPDTISGDRNVCVGRTMTLNNTLSGGTWSSSNPAIANIVPTGIVTGIAAGTARITYLVAGGCKATQMITVNSNPSVINGIASVCAGANTTLTNAATGGSWSSGNTAVAIINAASGVVSGVASGTALVSYSFSTGCYATKIVTVNAVPTPILGTLAACTGSTTLLTNATTPAVAWSSNNTSVATINSGTGVTSGVAAGTAVITYAIGTGCYTTAIFTVNPTPSPISGGVWVCEGATTSLSSATSGGTWASSIPAVGTVNTAGVVTGILAGTTRITYTLSGGCYKTQVVTVNTMPSAISGISGLCVGSSATLASTPSGTGWNSSVPSVATIGTGGVVTGLAAGVTNISFTRNGCMVSAFLTVTPLPANITGPLNVCAGVSATLSSATTGGTWASTLPSVATIGSSTGTVVGVAAGTAQISYTLGTGCYKTTVVTVNTTPATISGATPMCSGVSSTFTNATSGGNWSSSNTTAASVHSTTGVVTANAAGNTTIAYTTGAGCVATFALSVTASPSAIGGTKTVCVGSATTLTNSVSGGTWSSSDPSKGSINAVTGVVTGLAPGVTSVVYSTGAGCPASTIVTINSSPSISGTSGICAGFSTTLSGSPSGGTWTTTSPLVGVNATTGIVTAGTTTGVAIVTYSIGGACKATFEVTVNTAPSTISGAPTVCKDLATTFTNATAGGVWSSNNVSAATVDTSTGVVTGVTAGASAVITYTLGGSCWKVKGITVNAVPPAIAGYQTACTGLTTQFLIGTSGGAWSSSDTNVARITIGSGIITGVAVGTANITYDKGGCVVSRAVTIIANPGTIAGSRVVCVGLQTSLSNAVPGGAWSSSNTAVAIVGSTGVVTAGTFATGVTISYNFGANCRSTAIVTVKAVPAVIAGPATLCIGGTAVYSNTAAEGTWSSSNSAIASVISGSASTSAAFMGNSSGAVTLSYTNAPSCTRTMTVNVGACRGVNNATGIEGNNDKNASATLYPNPTSGKITVTAISAGILYLYTLEGREVSKFDVRKGETQISLPDNLATGIYMCRYNGENGNTVMVRLIVE
jgi:uncharacterized protein YjdB